jgi:REP element-mobilizing transposase RayT
MPRNPKCFAPNSVVEISFRTQRGLPFVAIPLIRLILKAVIAAAQALYPEQQVCDLVVMANHFHLMLITRDPSTLPAFIGYIKKESSHCFNRLTGRTGDTLWSEGYYSPPILDYRKVIKQLVYFYTNPQSANLVERIEDYPQLNSWQALLDGGHQETVRRVYRSSIPGLPERTLSAREHRRLAGSVYENSGEELEFRIDSFAWMECFAETREMDISRVRDMIVRLVRQKEEKLRRQRQQRKIRVKGAHALCLERIDMSYKPMSFGKKMLCLSTDRSIRVAFIGWYRSQLKIIEELKTAWPGSSADFIRPPGFFAPGGYLAANLNPHLTHPIWQV